jgi:hypothetical protein
VGVQRKYIQVGGFSSAHRVNRCVEELPAADVRDSKYLWNSYSPQLLSIKKQATQVSQRYVGAYSDGVPPLPIPNRAVKPVCADGTWVDAQGE